MTYSGNADRLLATKSDRAARSFNPAQLKHDVEKYEKEYGKTYSPHQTM